MSVLEILSRLLLLLSIGILGYFHGRKKAKDDVLLYLQCFVDVCEESPESAPVAEIGRSLSRAIEEEII